MTTLSRREVQINGVSLFLHEQGMGMPLIFVHGSVADHTTFAGQVKRFSHTHRAIAYSRRFHPPNTPPMPGECYDMLQQADDLNAILDSLGTEEAVVIGSSFGGCVALMAALRSRGGLRGLVLCEPPMLPLLLHHPEGTPLYENFSSSVTVPAREAFLRGCDEDALRVFIDGVRGQSGSFERMLPATKEELRGFASELRAEFLTEDLLYMPAISPKDLRSVATPTLLMGGALSTPLFGAILDVLNTNLPNSTRVLIPKAGHMVHLQNADEFERSVRKFLQELDGHCT